MANALLGDLRKLIAEKKVLVIVGSGVSIAATQNAPAASWKGLLKLGVQRCRDLDPELDEDSTNILAAEIESRDLDNILSAAEKVAKKFGNAASRNLAAG